MPEVIALAVYTLAAFGLAFVLGFAEITVAARDWLMKKGVVLQWFVKLLECPACVGFHIGLWYALVASPEFMVTLKGGPVELAFFTAATNFVIGRSTGLIQE